jgi:ribosomal protein L7/L12
MIRSDLEFWDDVVLAVCSNPSSEQAALVADHLLAERKKRIEEWRKQFDVAFRDGLEKAKKPTAGEVDLFRSGSPVPAIKAHRARTGLPLHESKRLLEEEVRETNLQGENQ